jgi:hypothetical protein
VKIIFFFLLLLHPPLYSADFTYLKTLLKQAETNLLANDREWRILLHYQAEGNGYVSEVDDPKFFNAPNGKTNPSAELAATLRAFFIAPTQQCKFIARYEWLKQQLAFKASRLPSQPCPRFKEWLNELNPYGLSLIFPAAYLNNPSSMFGHTLLRIDQAKQNEQSRLLAHAINYAANTKEENGVTFAIKGIFGDYPGLFSIMPYYHKVKEYSNLENRNVWEYQLNFTPAEIQRLLKHVWELDKIYFEYYFFDENCAYHLLSLLEVARPSLDLRNKFSAWAIPAETVRAIVAIPGLLKKATFRPANLTKLRHNLDLLSSAEQDWVQKLATGKINAKDSQFTALDTTTRIKILETAYDYLHYKHKKTDKTRSRRLRALLVARSQLPSTTSFSPPPVPPRPEHGHRSFRITAGWGRYGEQSYHSLQLRPAYHDLLDSDAGYKQGAQINFLNLNLQHPIGSSDLKLESLKIIDIASLSSRDRFFKPLSWKISSGWQRRQLDDNKRSLVYNTNGGVGFSYKPIAKALAYGFLEANLDIGGTLRHDYAFGLGSSVGMFVDILPNWRLHLYAETQRFVLGHIQSLRDFGLEQRLNLSRNSAIRLQMKRHYFAEEKAISQIELNWQWYF